MASSTQLKVVFHKAVALRRMQSELYGTQDPYARAVLLDATGTTEIESRRTHCVEAAEENVLWTAGGHEHALSFDLRAHVAAAEASQRAAVALGMGGGGGGGGAGVARFMLALEVWNENVAMDDLVGRVLLPLPFDEEVWAAGSAAAAAAAAAADAAAAAATGAEEDGGGSDGGDAAGGSGAHLTAAAAKALCGQNFDMLSATVGRRTMHELEPEGAVQVTVDYRGGTNAFRFGRAGGPRRSSALGLLERVSASAAEAVAGAGLLPDGGGGGGGSSSSSSSSGSSGGSSSGSGSGSRRRCDPVFVGYPLRVRVSGADAIQNLQFFGAQDPYASVLLQTEPSASAYSSAGAADFDAAREAARSAAAASAQRTAAHDSGDMAPRWGKATHAARLVFDSVPSDAAVTALELEVWNENLYVRSLLATRYSLVLCRSSTRSPTCFPLTHSLLLHSFPSHFLLVCQGSWMR